MEWADLAVSAGGSTCWELAFMGVPTVVLVLTEDQNGVGKGLAAEDIAVNLGWHEEVSEEQIAEALRKLIEERVRREMMSARGRQLIDGQGAERAVAALLSDSG
jgi:spore coat polysaccharide biosynthesis predicted glycosyltransferase SpsG